MPAFYLMSCRLHVLPVGLQRLLYQGVELLPLLSA